MISLASVFPPPCCLVALTLPKAREHIALLERELDVVKAQNIALKREEYEHTRGGGGNGGGAALAGGILCICWFSFCC